MEQILIDVAKAGSLAGTLVAILWIGFKAFTKQIDKGSKECAERERRMAERIDTIEDRAHTDSQKREAVYQDVLKTCASALATNAETFKRFTDQGSGTYHRLPEKPV